MMDILSLNSRVKVRVLAVDIYIRIKINIIHTLKQPFKQLLSHISKCAYIQQAVCYTDVQHLNTYERYLSQLSVLWTLLTLYLNGTEQSNESATKKLPGTFPT